MEKSMSKSATSASTAIRRNLNVENATNQLEGAVVGMRDAIEALEAHLAPLLTMPNDRMNKPDHEAMLKTMVDRFLGWKLPADFMPDAGISFELQYGHESPHWPTGTNLLHAGQALEMFKHCVAPVDQRNADLAASLNKARVAMRAFTNPEGDMPEDTGEFRDLKSALLDAEAVLSGGNSDEQQVVEPVANVSYTYRGVLILANQHDIGHRLLPGDTLNLKVAIDEVVDAVAAAQMELFGSEIREDAARRIRTADVVIGALLQKVGGEVVVSDEDAEKLFGYSVKAVPCPENKSVTFSLFKTVPVTVQ